MNCAKTRKGPSLHNGGCDQSLIRKYILMNGNRFVYSIQLNENKKIKASPPLGLLSKALNRALNASNDIISQPSDSVNSKKQKTLYIVTALIGKEGYRKEDPQLINANSLDVTLKSGSADASIKSISQPTDSVNKKLSTRNTDSNRILLDNALESTVQTEIERKKLQDYRENIDSLYENEAKLSELNRHIGAFLCSYTVNKIYNCNCKFKR